MSQSTARKRELGALVRARRKQLHLSQDDVHALGGPAAATLRKIEAGNFGDLRLGTTWPLERVLGWRPGDIQGFFMYPDKTAIEPAVEPNYDALRVDGDLPSDVPGSTVGGPQEHHQRPALNIPDDVSRDLSDEQLAELEARLVAEAWRARREIMGGG